MGIIVTLSAIIALLIGALAVTLTTKQQEIINESKAFCVDYSDDPYSTLKAGLIGDMISKYENDHLDAINTKMQNENNSYKIKHEDYRGSESITFDLEILQKFMYHIKRGVKINSKDPKDLENEKLGLRIYYAAYPEKALWGENGYKELSDLSGDDTTKKYEKKLTLVMVPVRENQKGEVVDFHPYFSGTYETGLAKYRRPDVADTDTDPAADGDTGAGGDSVLEINKIDTKIDPDNDPEAEVMALTGTDVDNLQARNHGNLYPPYSSSKMAFKI